MLDREPPAVKRMRNTSNTDQQTYDATPPGLQRILTPPTSINRDADKLLHKGTGPGR